MYILCCIDGRPFCLGERALPDSDLSILLVVGDIGEPIFKFIYSGSHNHQNIAKRVDDFSSSSHCRTRMQDCIRGFRLHSVERTASAGYRLVPRARTTTHCPCMPKCLRLRPAVFTSNRRRRCKRCKLYKSLLTSSLLSLPRSRLSAHHFVPKRRSLQHLPSPPLISLVLRRSLPVSFGDNCLLANSP